jgi:hypothetical protein
MMDWIFDDGGSGSGDLQDCVTRSIAAQLDYDAVYEPTRAPSPAGSFNGGSGRSSSTKRSTAAPTTRGAATFYPIRDRLLGNADASHKAETPANAKERRSL